MYYKNVRSNCFNSILYEALQMQCFLVFCMEEKCYEIFCEKNDSCNDDSIQPSYVMKKKRVKAVKKFFSCRGELPSKNKYFINGKKTSQKKFMKQYKKYFDFSKAISFKRR